LFLIEKTTDEPYRTRQTNSLNSDRAG
jgi:hypothetical protein